MKQNSKTRLTAVCTKQTENVSETGSSDQKQNTICLGIDMGKYKIVVTQIVGNLGPKSPRKFSDWEAFYRWVEQMVKDGDKVYAVYEAGIFGFVPHRRLTSLGVEAYVAHPERLDIRGKRVQTDKTDSRQLAIRLHRYVNGDKSAMRVVYVPTEEEEKRKTVARHRKHLKEQIKALEAHGCGLLMKWGYNFGSKWWAAGVWEVVESRVNEELRYILGDTRKLLLLLEGQLEEAEERVTGVYKEEKKELPVGFGVLTYALIVAELCNFFRFKNRRRVAGFSGLCGGVSQSGGYHLQLSINKCGSPYLRALLIELAWRMVKWQPGYVGVKMFQKMCGGDWRRASSSRRKRAIVALGRRLLVDIWRCEVGLTRYEALGFRMCCAG